MILAETAGMEQRRLPPTTFTHSFVVDWHTFCIDWAGLQHRQEISSLGSSYLFETTRLRRRVSVVWALFRENLFATSKMGVNGF
jgi:hypothetical protein